MPHINIGLQSKIYPGEPDAYTKYYAAGHRFKFKNTTAFIPRPRYDSPRFHAAVIAWVKKHRRGWTVAGYTLKFPRTKKVS